MFGASDAILEAIGNRGHTSYLADSGAAATARRTLATALGENFATEYEAGKIASFDELIASVEQAVLAEPTLPPKAPAGATDAAAPPSLVQYFEKDDSVFLDHDYVVRGVPGRLLWRMLQIHDSEGRSEFTNRELRLDPAINFPAS
jgi:hypothetical protein